LKNASFFSQSDNSWKTRRYRSDEDLAAQAARVEAAIKAIAHNEPESPIYRLLSEMFPGPMRGLLARRKRIDSNDDLAEAERGRRISHPDYFPIYFLYAVSDLVFSSVKMDRFVKELIQAQGDDKVLAAFDHLFLSLEADSVRRYDFVNKLVQRLQTLPLITAKSVAFAIAQNSDKFGDEFLVSERRRAVVAILQVAQRLSESEEINTLLKSCIALSKTDLFAANLYRAMTTDRANNKVWQNFEHVDQSKMQEAFAAQMTSRFGEDNAADISQVEMHAMLTWAELGPPEQSAEVAYWRRFIGNSRSRLADAFNVIAAKGQFWMKETPTYIDRIVGRNLLAQLDAELPEDPNLSPQQQEGLVRLKRFLNNEIHDDEILGERAEYPMEGPHEAAERHGA
jgi:hypothetical protein